MRGCSSTGNRGQRTNSAKLLIAGFPQNRGTGFADRSYSYVLVAGYFLSAYINTSHWFHFLKVNFNVF
jgi:hypothetical protein